MKIEDTSGQDIAVQKTGHSRRNLLIAATALLAVLLVVFVQPALSKWSGADASVSEQRVRLATVTRGDFVRDLSVQGRVVAAVSPKLYSPAQGTVTFTVTAGDTVEQDQILATIDSPELTNTLKQEQASLQELQMTLDRQKIQAKKQQLENQKAVDLANVALTAADREKRRADEAFRTHAISKLDFEKAQDDLENARLVYQHAVSDAELNKESLAFEIQSQQLQLTRQTLLVEELNRQVAELTVRSPVTGLVGNLAVEQKNQVAKNQAILSVVDLSEFQLDVGIPESYADDLAIGMDAQVSLNGETYSATLVTLSPEIENNQVTGRVRFATQNQAGEAIDAPKGLRQNQRLMTRILMENKSDVIKVKRGQFLETGSGRIAYVVQNGSAQRTRIQTGARSLSEVEILGGLSEGDTIIISGTEQFRGADNVLITQ